MQGSTQHATCAAARGLGCTPLQPLASRKAVLEKMCGCFGAARRPNRPFSPPPRGTASQSPASALVRRPGATLQTPLGWAVLACSLGAWRLVVTREPAERAAGPSWPRQRARAACACSWGAAAASLPLTPNRTPNAGWVHPEKGIPPPPCRHVSGCGRAGSVQRGAEGASKYCGTALATVAAGTRHRSVQCMRLTHPARPGASSPPALPRRLPLKSLPSTRSGGGALLWWCCRCCDLPTHPRFHAVPPESSPAHPTTTDPPVRGWVPARCT